MKIRILFMIVCMPLLVIASEEKTDSELSEKIERALSEIKKIKLGMTRADLSKAFTTEGGISSPSQRQYVYKTCPYIKVEVRFVPVSKSEEEENPQDKISSISKPFLELCISD